MDSLSTLACSPPPEAIVNVWLAAIHGCNGPIRQSATNVNINQNNLKDLLTKLWDCLDI
jgi:hypothetical protein